MPTMTTAAPTNIGRKLLTAEEFFHLPDPPSGARQELVAAPLFLVDRFDLIEPREFSQDITAKSTVQILTVFGGSGTVIAENCDPVRMMRGDAVIIPASIVAFEVVPEGKLEMLRSIVPGGITTEPATFT